MGVEASARVWEHAPHDGTDLVVLLALADMADPSGVCYPGYPYLGLYTRLTHERNIRQRINKLRESGDVYSAVTKKRSIVTFLVATAMSTEEIEHVLCDQEKFDLPIDEARHIAADLVARQQKAQAEYKIDLSEMRRNRRRGRGPSKSRPLPKQQEAGGIT
jgi:hypothetical protein